MGLRKNKDTFGLTKLPDPELEQDVLSEPVVPTVQEQINALQAQVNRVETPQAKQALIQRIYELSKDMPAPLEQVTAQPMTSEELAGYDGVAMPEIEPVTPEALQTPLPQPPMPKPSKIAASVEPGQTEAVKAAEAQRPEPDEAEKLMGEYRKAREGYETEAKGLEAERAAGETQRQRMTGIAGALQAFGEGLAAITGGSAKPLQTGVAAVQRIGEQRAAAEERKARSLKERLQQAKAPLEEKQMEMDLRTRLTKGKMEQGFLDPNSEQSKQARANATAFIDNMIAQGAANDADPAVLQRLEQTKGMLGQMNAQQVQDFYSTLKPLSTETSLEAKNKFDMQKMMVQENMRLKLAEAKDSKDQQKFADKEFLKVRSKIADEETAASKVGPQMEKFLNDLDAAIAGDKKAAKRVSQNVGVVTYLNARTYESKGVFTDNDLRALSQTDAGRTWFQQLDEFVSKGMTGNLPKESLMRIRGVVGDNIDKFREPGKFIRSNYAQAFREMENPAMNRYADVLERGEKAAKPKTAEQPAQPQRPIETAPKKVKFRIGNKIVELDPATQGELIKRAKDAKYEEVP